MAHKSAGSLLPSEVLLRAHEFRKDGTMLVRPSPKADNSSQAYELHQW